MDNFDFLGAAMSFSTRTSTQPDFFSAQVREARRFYLDLAPPEQIELVVVCGGCETCRPDYVIRRRDFPYYSLEFVAGGKGAVKLGRRRVALRPAVVFTYGPGVPQHITTDAKDPLVKYFVDFTGTRAERLLDSQSLSPGSAARVRDPARIQALFDELIHDGQLGSGFSQALCTALLEYLLLKVSDSLLPLSAAQTRAFATYQRCRRYIEENYQRLQGLEQLACECHVDRSYLCRLFRRFDRQTPYRLLMRLKMNWAAEQLQQSSVLVREVAAQLGFEDPYHFSRAFKHIFGVSPESFRRLR